MGRGDKGEWVSNIRVVNEVSFIMLQESQLASLNGLDMGRFWGRGLFDFEHVDATGRFGGLVSIWDQNFFQKTSVHKHRYFLAVHGIIKGSGLNVCLVNVCAPQKINDKRALWRELKRFMQHNSTYWIVGGNFNSVRDRSERRNTKFNIAFSNEFNDFIDKVELHEYGLKGRKFTFVSGNKCSRIDRIFVSLNFLNDWPAAEYRALAREKSDHSPLVLKVAYRNFEPKPFRFFNSWIDRVGFDDMIKRAASNFQGSGAPDVCLMKKFKFLRNSILDWKKTILQMEEQEQHTIMLELEELDKEVECRDLLDEEQWTFWEGKKRVKELEEFKSKDLRQKARVKWAREGDENSSFFHGVANKRRVSNFIPGLSVNGVWISKPSFVKREVFSFFRNKFIEEMEERPYLECFDLKMLSDAEAESLVIPFSDKEIKEALFDCGSDKAPGPDGFNFRFIKKYWALFEEDFKKIFLQFQDTGRINRGMDGVFFHYSSA
ncbi:uncharacterized protein LOC110944302 [Helianthus annuus]|uniref:uncharacterized protein LOC110944302 n=1 Tax=Helianthus annuus TaxID=4232 RepID=UPI0016531FD2|nr:uncharacterized protein LOC110944302 [Helianthus annuus]